MVPDRELTWDAHGSGHSVDEQHAGPDFLEKPVVHEMPRCEVPAVLQRNMERNDVRLFEKLVERNQRRVIFDHGPWRIIEKNSQSH